jgi:hypothetical protein
MKRYLAPIVLAAAFFAAALASLTGPQTATAHRDGCHRWHSCPSDTGSYVCGDLGYTSECPSTAPPARLATTYSVRRVSLTSPVRRGANAALTVGVSHTTTCSITVTYKSGRSHASGLYSKRSSGGRVSWQWKVASRTTPGRWPIVVGCGIGTLRTSFVVR